MTQQANQPYPCKEPLVEGKWVIKDIEEKVTYRICFSDHHHRTYRYWLEVKISLNSVRKDKGTCLFLMLNPSDTNEKEPDPTVEKCITFAKRWDYSTLVVCNLYAFRSPCQTDLRNAGYPIGPGNDEHITETAKCADKVILGWGSNVRRGRVSNVLEMLRDEGVELYVLTSPACQSPLTANGEPRHPLPRDNSLPVETTECVQVTTKQAARGTWRLRLL